MRSTQCITDLAHLAPNRMFNWHLLVTIIIVVLCCTHLRVRFGIESYTQSALINKTGMLIPFSSSVANLLRVPLLVGQATFQQRLKNRTAKKKKDQARIPPFPFPLFTPTPQATFFTKKKKASSDREEGTFFSFPRRRRRKQSRKGEKKPCKKKRSLRYHKEWREWREGRQTLLYYLGGQENLDIQRIVV